MPDLKLIFDLDDTLYPERDFAIGGFRAAARWVEQELRASVDVDRMVALLDEGHLGALFPVVLAEAKPDHTSDDLKNFVRAYGRQQPEISLFPDAAAALAHWQAVTDLGLITDGHAPTQRAKIAALLLDERFAHIIATGALGPDRAYHKPHPHAFELMQEKLGNDGDRFVYVGDNLSKDFVAPNALGWTSVWIDRPHHRHHRIHKAASAPAGGVPHVTIHDLGELQRVLG